PRTVLQRLERRVRRVIFVMPGQAGPDQRTRQVSAVHVHTSDGAPVAIDFSRSDRYDLAVGHGTSELRSRRAVELTTLRRINPFDPDLDGFVSIPDDQSVAVNNSDNGAREWRLRQRRHRE